MKKLFKFAILKSIVNGKRMCGGEKLRVREKWKVS